MTLVVFVLSAPVGANDSASDVLTSRYAGTIPCADCDGIRLVLELYEKTADGPPTRYSLERTYLGTREGEPRNVQVGEWTILRGSKDDPDSTVYQLDPGKPGKIQNYLRHGDRELVPLDQDLGAISSPLPGTLTRER